MVDSETIETKISDKKEEFARISKQNLNITIPSTSFS